MKKRMQILVNGIFKENPVLVLVPRLLSVLCDLRYAPRSLGMGAALTFVLVGSNVVISRCARSSPTRSVSRATSSSLPRS